MSKFKMLIIYFLIGLGMTTAHSDYGVWFRAQHFDKTVRNIDKDAIIKHQREKRFVKGYFVPQNLTNKPTWGNMNVTRNTTFTGPLNNSKNFEQKVLNNGTRPSNHVTVIYPRQNTTGFTLARHEPYGNMTDATGKYFNPSQTNNVNATWPVNPNYITVRPGYNSNGNNTFNATGYVDIWFVPVNPATPGHTRYPGYPGYSAPNAVYPASNTGYPLPNNGYTAPTTGYPAQNTGYPATNINPGQNYNTSVTRPVYPDYNNINVIPANKNNFSNSIPSGYNIQPVNHVTPGNRPYYPVPNAGYPVSNTSNPAPNTGYPAPNTKYPAPNTWYPSSNTGYQAPNTGYPAPTTGYPAQNTGYPATNNPGQNYNTSVTRPVYPDYNNINVIPANNNNFSNSNPSGYNIQPVNPVTPGNRPYYPVPNAGYPASNTSNPAPTTGYPAPNTKYPAPNTGYQAPNTKYPVPNTGYQAPNTKFPAPNTGYQAPNTGNGFNNTASLENCKCKLPTANSIITKEERSMDACMITCNNCPEGMKMSSFGICVKDLDYDDE